MTTQYTRRDQTVTMPQTTVVNHRAANAVNLAARHVTERDAKRITGRYLSNGRLVWKVESQTRAGVTYTVTRQADGWEFNTCTCGDSVGRHAHCKHRRAVDLLSPVAPAPVVESQGPNWDDPKLWQVPTTTERKPLVSTTGRRRYGVQEEI
mgnify:CR=1 FL=1